VRIGFEETTGDCDVIVRHALFPVRVAPAQIPGCQLTICAGRQPAKIARDGISADLALIAHRWNDKPIVD
ncbi:MAG: hypothetical protein VX815_04565, partial [Gemmatimonadota bacterium]|nr:hypothetical protein [Gemmatimonadota bacterium]